LSNGWTARDLLTIVAKENIDILTAQGAVTTGMLQTTPFNERIPALLLVGVLALCWEAATRPRPVADVPTTPSPSPVWGPREPLQQDEH